MSAFVSSVCVPASQLVAAGHATYDDTSQDGVSRRPPEGAHDVCYTDWEGLMAIRRDEEASCHVVIGKVGEGQACTTDLQCAPPDGDGSTACVTGACRTIRILGEDEPCPYPSGDVSTCDAGLYCTAAEQGDMGTCVPATPEGEACQPVFLNPECGLGSYLATSTPGVCRKATNYGGPSCTQDSECVSFLCDRKDDASLGQDT